MLYLRKNILSLLTFLSIAVAAFDYLVRNYTLGWTEAHISQLIVFLSPFVYIGLLTAIFYRLKKVPLGLSTPKSTVAATLIIASSVLLMAQVFLRDQAVGSARYSIVSPLFFSGCLTSIVTFMLFFRKERPGFVSFLICLACVLWILIPIGIDTLYLTQGGYRGPAPFQIAVISTSYDLIQYIAAFGIVFAIFTGPIAIIIGIYRTFKSKGIERLYSLSLALSMFALSVQFVNWGGFVWN